MKPPSPCHCGGPAEVGTVNVNPQEKEQKDEQKVDFSQVATQLLKPTRDRSDLGPSAVAVGLEMAPWWLRSRSLLVGSQTRNYLAHSLATGRPRKEGLPCQVEEAYQMDPRFPFPTSQGPSLVALTSSLAVPELFHANPGAFQTVLRWHDVVALRAGLGVSAEVVAPKERYAKKKVAHLN